MSATFDAVSTSDSIASGVTSINHTNLTVGTGSNRALVVQSTFSNQGITSLAVTWDSGGTNQSVASIIAANTTSGTGRAALHGRVAPTSGNKTLNVAWTGSSDVDVCAVAWTSVDQTGGATTFPHSTSNTGTSATASVTITSATGNATMDSVANSVVGDLSSPTQTQTYLNITGANVASAGSRAAGNSSVTHQWTVTSASGQWVSVGTDILAVAAGSTGLLLDGGHLTGHGLLTGSGKLAA